MEFTISPLEIDEIPRFWQTFSDILKTEFPEYTPRIITFFLEKIYTPANFSYWINTGAKIVFIAKTNDTDEIIGFAVVDEPYGGVSACRWLGVKKEYQKKGAGKLLVKTWLDEAKKQRCHKAELAARLGAGTFYEKVGLTREGKRTRSYFAIDQYIFGTVLQDPDEDAITAYH